MAAKCSYHDAAGGHLTQLKGKVLTATASGLPDPVPETAIVVRRAGGRGSAGAPASPGPPGTPGPVVATGRTDAQGGFTLSVVLKPGRYQVSVPSAAGAASQEFEVGPSGSVGPGGRSDVGELTIWVAP